VTAPVVSFRDPLYSAVALCLPCPPPATVGGLLAAVAGGWDEVDPDLRFAMAFSALATGVDLETYRPLEQRGTWGQPVPRDRHFLHGAELTVWLTADVDLWRRRFRRPVWPLRLGRSQDLATARCKIVTLRRGAALPGSALLPAETSSRGTLMQLPTSISRDRARVLWGSYRHHRSVGSGRLGPQPQAAPLGRGSGPGGWSVSGSLSVSSSAASSAFVADGWATPDGRLVEPLPPVHPCHAERDRRV
jgi:CRISPR-associated endonuclease/helicase Cas3/CRISPR-associated protein Cas5t